MKFHRLALAALALSASVGIGSAFADSYSDGSNTTVGKTRAEVRAELEQARANGQLLRGDSMLPESAQNALEIGAQGSAGSRYSGKTRQEVKAELAQAISEGFRPMASDVGYPDSILSSGNNNPVSLRTRQEVRQEAIDFFKAHPEARY